METKPNNKEKLVSEQAVEEFLKSTPAWTAPPEDDLTRLFKKYEGKVSGVRLGAGAIVENALTSSAIQTPKGRHDLKVFIHKRFVESFHDMNREELLFLLAWSEANRFIESIV